MDHPIAQPQPQFVLMPMAERNTLGVFAFFIALLGLFIPTGIVAMLGLILSLAAIGRSPRGFATAGVILGLLGTIGWLAIMAIAVIAGAVAAIGIAVVAAGAFVLTQPETVELTSDMINVAIAVQDYERQHDEVPTDMAVLALGVASTIDPWGGGYRLVRVDEDPGFDIVSRGPDGSFETDDDVRLSRLDRCWEEAFDNFDERLEEFCRRVEGLQDLHGGPVRWPAGGHPSTRVTGPRRTTYEEEARRQLRAVEGDDSGR